MKVIGMIEHKKYICEVSHIEIEKFLNLYYGKKRDLNVGDVIDLGSGYNFQEKCETALKKTADMIESNKEIIEAIMKGIRIFKTQEKENEL